MSHVARSVRRKNYARQGRAHPPIIALSLVGEGRDNGAVICCKQHPRYWGLSAAPLDPLLSTGIWRFRQGLTPSLYLRAGACLPLLPEPKGVPPFGFPAAGRVDRPLALPALSESWRQPGGCTLSASCLASSNRAATWRRCSPLLSGVTSPAFRRRVTL